jgi:putative ABC transport system substrate-binding protein
MRRRDFIAGLGSAAVAWPRFAWAQQRAVPVVGYLGTRTADSDQYLVDTFRQGLNEAGFVEGRDVTFEYRWARNDNNRLPELAADLVRRQVAIIVTLADEPATVAAKAATSTIPIFFHTGVDPVEIGLVASFNRPGGNVTGVTSMNWELTAKRLGLLRELVPAATRFAVLVSPDVLALESLNRDMQAAASAMGLQIDVVFAGTDREIDTAFASLVQNRVDALLVSSTQLLASRSEKLITLAARHVVPAIYALRDQAENGGLMSYGPSIPGLARQWGIYAGRILKSEKPADLPVTRPTKFELVINLKTAKTLGLTVPLTLLVQADELIE